MVPCLEELDVGPVSLRMPLVSISSKLSMRAWRSLNLKAINFVVVSAQT